MTMQKPSYHLHGRTSSSPASMDQFWKRRVDMEERLQNTAAVQLNHVIAHDGTKRRFLQRTVQPIRNVKSGGSLTSLEGSQLAQQKPPLHPQYSAEQRALHAKLFQEKVAVEEQVQQHMKQMQQLGLHAENDRPSSRALAGASTPALHAALRGKTSQELSHQRTESNAHALKLARLGSAVVSKISDHSRGVSPSPSQVRPQSCSTHSSVSRLSAGNLWRASDSAVSGGRSRSGGSEVDSQIGYLEETLAREKLRRMAAESELAYLKEVVLTTRQQLSRPLL